MLQRLTNICKKEIKDQFGGFEVNIFGSTANGLCLEGSPDIDISINFDDPYVNKNIILRLISKWIKEEMSLVQTDGEVAYKEVVKTMVPLIKIIDKETNLDVDIVVNGLLGVKNSLLIWEYTKLNVWFHKLGLLLKWWAKYFKILGATDGFLSSYAYVLMMISFLQ